MACTAHPRRSYIYILCQILYVFLDIVICFNVDTRTANVINGPRNSWFGFSVAQHTTGEGSAQWFLIGAPKAQTTQRKVTQGGAVYRCAASHTSSRCTQIPFDEKGSNIRWNGTSFVPREEKSHQWFGATLHSAENGFIVACAPRYVYFSAFLSKRDPIGTCWMADSASDTFHEYSPCKRESDQDQSPGIVGGKNYCQAGMAAAVTKDGHRLIIGGVGSYYWQGQIFSKDLKEPVDDFFPEYYQQTPEGTPDTDDAYRGYSLTLGDFNEDGVQDIATGVPKFNDLFGKVTIYDENLTSIAEVNGTQMGAYFGYSVASADWNGDGLDDLVVGAPLFTDYKTRTYETGAVHVFYNRRTRQGSKPHFDVGVRLSGARFSGSRFGFSVSSLGDINNDNFNDLVVGAPYDGEDVSGAIYIFHGSLKGIRKKYSQVIYGTDVGISLSTFGFSVSGGRDQDRNMYPDILVGAYQSDSAVYLRSRPIIRVQAQLTFEPEIIDLDRKECNTTDGIPVTCVSLYTCMVYSGAGVPEEIDLELNWNLDSVLDKSKRMFYISADQKQSRQNSTIRVQRNMRYCKTSFAYVKNAIRDKLRPISAELGFRLQGFTLDESSDQHGGGLTPIMDQYTPNTVTGQAQILKDCGSDNICIPDLIITAKSLSPPHVMGLNYFLDIAVHVTNQGEDAFEAEVKITLPPGVSYVNVYEVSSVVPVQCSAAAVEHSVLCSIGNPLPANARVHFQLRTSPKRVFGNSSSIQYFMLANSSNPENHTTVSSNFAAVNIEVQAVVDIRIIGVSKPEQVVYNSTYSDLIQNEADIGPEVTHLYEVRNLGPSMLKSAAVEILWPGLLMEGKPLLYLTRVPRILKGSGACHVDGSHVNPLNITLIDSHMASAVKQNALTSAQPDKSGSYAVSGNSYWKRQDQLKDKLTCNSGWCSVISCTTGSLSPEENILIEIKSRVWLQTLIKGRYRGVKISSQAVARVKEVPYAFRPQRLASDTFQVHTYVAPQYKEQRPVDLMIVLVSAGVGLLLLVLIVIILWRCGFFKRQKLDEKDILDQKADQNNHSNTTTNGKCREYKYDDDQL